MTGKINFFDETAQHEYISAVRSIFESAGKIPSAAVITYGCQQNESDSEHIEGLLELMGYSVQNPDEIGVNTELVILNTCAIREHAELKALSGAGSLKKLKESNKSLLIGICGCMVQEKHRSEQIKKSYPYVDFMFGTDGIHLLPEILYKALSGSRRVYSINTAPHSEFGNIAENIPVKRKSLYKAWVPVMYGCDNFCTYCVVPYVRGKERSRSEQATIGEIRALIDNGCKDITLLGQNVNSYKGENGDFVALLEKILALDGDFRIRFMTSHPKDVPDSLIEIMNHPKMAKSFHLPFQSGSDRILKLMNRRYTASQYLERALKIRETVPDCAVSSDVICGFPTETDEDFEKTLEIVEKVGFDMLFAFLYSPRKGTPAAQFDGQIEHSVKLKRFNMLTELYNKVSNKQNLALVGSVQRVLCDGGGIGRSSQNKIIRFADTQNTVKSGEFANIKVKDVSGGQITGTIVK